MSLLDDLLPSCEFRSRHTRWIRAEPADVWRSLHEVTAAETPLTSLLTRLRTVGRARPAGRLVDNLPLRQLATDPGREAVYGQVATFWHLRPTFARFGNGDDRDDGTASDGGDLAAAFREFDRPGWAKAAMSFHLVPEHAGTRLAVETRVHATDAASRRRFAPYWLLIRAGGAGLIRVEILGAVARHAETGPHPDRTPIPRTSPND